MIEQDWTVEEEPLTAPHALANGWVQGANLPVFGTNHVKTLTTIAGLVEPVPTVMYLTSSNWAELALEITIKYGKKPTPGTFRELIIGCLTVRNAFTEDQAAVNMANEIGARNANFQEKRKALVSGKN
jgi:hypothetical protein